MCHCCCRWLQCSLQPLQRALQEESQEDPPLAERHSLELDVMVCKEGLGPDGEQVTLTV